MQSDYRIGYITFLASVAALGGFLFGYDTAVISGTITQVASQMGLDATLQGWYVGCALVGSIVGVACAGTLADALGRRPSMLIAAVLFTASAIGCAFAHGLPDLVLWRIVGGAGIGVASIVCPMYISEISVPQCRGRLVSLYQVAITVGFLGAYLVNYGLLQNSLAWLAANTALVSAPDAIATAGWYDMLFHTQVWRGMLGMETVPAVLFLAVLFFIPESPRWLVARLRLSRARSILAAIYASAQAATRQLRQIQQAVSASAASEESISWRLLLRPGIRTALLAGSAIAILGQFMGVNAVLYYGPMIFEDAGLSGSSSLLYQVVVGAVNTVTALLALAIIDRVGRKKLVYWGVSGMILGLLVVAAYFCWGPALGIPHGVLLAAFLFYVFACAVSICAVVWVLLSEMYPLRVRAMAMSVAGMALWIGTYLVGQLTPWLLQTITPTGTFLLFAFMCLPYLYIMWRFIPETAGRSLEEIERYWLPDEN